MHDFLFIVYNGPDYILKSMQINKMTKLKNAYDDTK